MTYSEKKLITLDDMISRAELNQEKAHMMASILDQGYFDEKDDRFKLYYFDNASIEHDILFDYIAMNTQLLKEIRKLLNEEADNIEEEAPCKD